MKKFEMPNIQVVKFSCDSDAITTSSYMVDIDTNGYNNATTNVDEIINNGSYFLDNL